MSAPHTAINPLVACPHIDGGWCLLCVQELVRDHEEEMEDAYADARHAADAALDGVVDDCISDVEAAIRDAIDRRTKPTPRPQK